jgi:hypothetical protein
MCGGPRALASSPTDVVNVAEYCMDEQVTRERAALESVGKSFAARRRRVIQQWGSRVACSRFSDASARASETV